MISYMISYVYKDDYAPEIREQHSFLNVGDSAVWNALSAVLQGFHGACSKSWTADRSWAIP